MTPKAMDLYIELLKEIRIIRNILTGFSVTDRKEAADVLQMMGGFDLCNKLRETEKIIERDVP